jgi:adenylate kinase
MKTVLFHGPSGSGKDTQVELLVKDYNFENIGTGEMFRKMYSDGDVDAIRAHQYWSKGKFVPDKLTYKMLEKWIKQFNQERNWAFVSVVRSKGQIPLFENVLKEANRELDYFVHFVLSEEHAIERMSLRWVCPNCHATYHEKYKKESVKGYCNRCGTKLIQREDDRPDRIKMRLMEYNRTIDPIIDYYKNKGILIEIDASPSIEEIHKVLVEKLKLNELELNE